MMQWNGHPMPGERLSPRSYRVINECCMYCKWVFYWDEQVGPILDRRLICTFGATGTRPPCCSSLLGENGTWWNRPSRAEWEAWAWPRWVRTWGTCDQWQYYGEGDGGKECGP